MRDLFFLSCGGFAPPGLAIRPLGKGLLSAGRLSNTVAVAVRDNGDIVLVDAGWSTEACERPVPVLGRGWVTGLAVRVKAADAIASQLRGLGLDPARVRAIVATHLHLDHVGGVGDFPNAEVVVSQRELQAYWHASKLSGYRAQDLARAGRIRTVLLSGTPSYGFPGSFDVFGQGDVVMLDAAGHSAGNVAVALRGPSGTFVHVGDAVYQNWEFGLAPAGPCLIARQNVWSRDAQKKTYASIRSCEADPRRPVVVPSHDQAVFDRLPHAPKQAP